MTTSTPLKPAFPKAMAVDERPSDEQLLLALSLLLAAPRGLRRRLHFAVSAYKVGRGAGLPRLGAAARARRVVASAADAPLLASRFSTLVEHVCEAYCPTEAVAERARRLEVALATFLNERRVLRFRQVSPSGLDDWAASASVVFVHAAVRACALCRGGDVW